MLTLTPKIPDANMPVAAYGVSITAPRSRHMATNVVHPQHRWHILPQILQRQALDLLVEIKGLLKLHLLRRLVQQAVDLSLDFGICWGEGALYPGRLWR